MAWLVKNPPAMQKTRVPFLGGEDPLEKGTPVFWPGEFLGLYCPWGCKESDTTERLSKEMSIHNRLKSIDSALGSEERM